MAKFTNNIVYKIISLLCFIAIFSWMRPIIANADLDNVNNEATNTQSTEDFQDNSTVQGQGTKGDNNISEGDSEYIPTEQFDCFLSEQSSWLDDDEHYKYAVTDYDQDGNLELSRTIRMGSGGYNYSDFFEYDNGHLNKISFSDEYEYSQPNPAVNKADSFYDPETGIYYYYLIDAARNGSWETLKTYLLFSFGDNNELSVRQVKSEYTQHDNSTGLDEVTYYDADKNEIDEATYNYLDGEALPGCEKKECRFKWFEGSEIKENVSDKLYESWAGFKMEDK